MKQLTIIIISLFLSLLLQAQKFETRHANGNLKELGQFLNGQKTGEWKVFNEDNKLTSKGQYNNGLKIGFWSTFQYRSTEEGSYQNGTKTGLWKKFAISSYLKDTIPEEIGLYENGLKIGEWKLFNYGTLISIENYQSGKLHGLYTEYSDTKIEVKGEYNMGIKTSVWESYNSEGRLIITSEFLDESRLIVSFYNENGNIVRVDKVIIGETLKDLDIDFNNLTFYYSGLLIKLNESKSYYDSGGLQSELYLTINDTTSHQITDYYENGNIKEIGSLQLYLGKKLGEWKYYYENGNILKKGNYTKSHNLFDIETKHEKWEYYYESGNLFETRIYSNEGKDYESVFYFKNGNILANGNYKNERKVGTWNFYHSNRQISEVKEYSIANQNIRIHQEIKGYHANGEVRFEGTKYYGEKNGEWKYYYSNGQLKQVGLYNDGNKILVWKTFYSNGFLKTEENYSKNYKSGKFSKYYQNGVIKENGQYSNGFKTGIWTKYYDTGKIKEKGKYLKKNFSTYQSFQHQLELNTLLTDINQKDSIWNVYHNNGVLHHTSIWEKGKLVEISTCQDSIKQPLDKGSFKDGDGSVNYYYNGVLTIQQNFELNRQKGDQKSFYPNGNIKEILTIDTWIKNWAFFSENKEAFQKRQYESYNNNYYLLSAYDKANFLPLEIGGLVDGNGISVLYDFEGALIDYVFIEKMRILYK